MYCPNCGKPLPDDAAFCGKCGYDLNAPPKGQPPRRTITPGPVPPVAPRKGISAKMIGFVAAFVIAVVALTMVYLNYSKTINLDKYVTVNYEGYDGYGTASVSIDWDSIQKKYASKISYTKAGSQELSGLTSVYTPVAVLEEYVGAPSLDRSEGLSNGDSVNYTWNIDTAELSKYLKCKIKYKDKTLEVSGLEEVEEFDPFENLQVTYGGVGPQGTVSFEYNGSELSAYDFSCDQSDGLSNGDKITVTLSLDDINYFAQVNGKVPSTTEKEYTVEGLGTYTSNVTDIKETDLETIKKSAENVVTTYANGISDDATISSVSYVGDYLAVSTEEGYSYYNNILGMVYKISGKLQASTDYDAVKFTAYYEVKYTNVITNADGTTTVDSESYDTSRNWIIKKAYYGTYSWNYRSYYIYGYESKSDLTSAVNENYSDYDLSWNMDEEETESAAETTKADSSNDADYICSYSSKRAITKSELKAYKKKSYNFPGNRSVVKMLINEIYARHGCIFKDDELNTYFGKKAWYKKIKNKTKDQEAIYEKFSQVEKDNIKFLQDNA